MGRGGLTEKGKFLNALRQERQSEAVSQCEPEREEREMGDDAGSTVTLAGCNAMCVYL